MYIAIESSVGIGSNKQPANVVHTFETEKEIKDWILASAYRAKNAKVYKAEELQINLELKLVSATSREAHYTSTDWRDR
jgi:hypothetical protein